MVARSNNSLTIGLAALLALRALLSIVPGAWGWSLDLQRHAIPPLAWGLWALAALLCVPALARALAPWVARAAALADRSPRIAGALIAIGTAVLVFTLPDRTWFTGDFLMRVGVLESRVPLGRIAPQALPLDLALHVEWPRRLASSGWIDEPSQAVRGLGAIVAALLAAVAFAAAGREGRRGEARLVFTAVVLGGGSLALLTGYGKTAGELVVLTLAAGALLPRFVREGRGAVALAIALAAALLLHRSALLLLPAWIAAWLLAARGGVLPRGLAARVLGMGLPLAALVLVGPRIAGLLGRFDLPRHLAVSGSGAEAWSLVGLVDRMNVALVWAPLAPLLALTGLRAARGGALARPRALTLALAAPAMLMVLLVTPQQGLFRDWDVFAIPGTLLALATARALTAGAGNDRSNSGSAPLLASAMLGSWLWLLAGYDDRGGLARVRELALGPPDRPVVHVAKAWEFLGDRAAALGRWPEAAAALRVAVVHQPSPRLLLMLAMAEATLGNLEAAESAASRAAARDSNSIAAWTAWGSIAMRRGNENGAREAARGLRRIAPEHPLVRELLGEAGR